MENDMRKLIDQVKNFGKLLNESEIVDTNHEKYEMVGASISTIIRKELMELGFGNIDKKRDDNYFINQFKIGVGTIITTQVHFSEGKIQVFFKLLLKGNNETEFPKIFDEIKSIINNKHENGEWSHLGVDFTIEYNES